MIRRLNKLYSFDRECIGKNGQAGRSGDAGIIGENGKNIG
jgi:hypothetical protein